MDNITDNPKKESPSSDTRENLEIESEKNEADSSQIPISCNEQPVRHSIQHQLSGKREDMPESKSDEAAYAVPVTLNASENNSCFEKHRTLENDKYEGVNLKQNNVDFNKSMQQKILVHGGSNSSSMNSCSSKHHDFPEIHKTTVDNTNADIGIERERKSSIFWPFKNPLYGVFSNHESAFQQNLFKNKNKYKETNNKKDGRNAKISNNKLHPLIEPTPNYQQFPISNYERQLLLPKRREESMAQADNPPAIDNLVYSPLFSASLQPSNPSTTCSENRHECIEIGDVPNNEVRYLSCQVKANKKKSNVSSPGVFITNCRLSSSLEDVKPVLYPVLFLWILIAVVGGLGVSFSSIDHSGFVLICAIEFLILFFALAIFLSTLISK